jgi:hypothetical protein
LTATKEITLEAGSEYVKLLPETATAVCWTRLVLLLVSQGTAEVVVSPLKLKVWLTAEPDPLMATITMVVGEELLVFL